MPLNWGNYPRVHHEQLIELYWRDQVIPFDHFKQAVLPHGQGKSYGDSCLNENGILLSTKHLNRFIRFDSEEGILECESGITLKDILDVIVPKGWILPVLPGTSSVSLGGAIANDIHGKNHHSAGSFGNHVLSIELLRSNGQKYLCSRDYNGEFFYATLGGLGLTGLILSARIQLRRLHSSYIEAQYCPFQTIEQFFDLAYQSEEDYEYTVSWLDCTAKGRNKGRGIFIRANTAEVKRFDTPGRKRRLRVPFYFPSNTLNRTSVKLFNDFYFSTQRKKIGTKLIPYDVFFFPLDSIQHWNRIYGKTGFFQYQCVIPHRYASHIKDILTSIVHAGQGSFLSVLKTFGDRSSGGLLSFPMKGVTLALDFPYRGKSTLDLLNRLDAIVLSYGGRVYPAKDARMSAEAFKTYFTEWETFSQFIDPQFSSSFWRRVTTHET